MFLTCSRYSPVPPGTKFVGTLSDEIRSAGMPVASTVEGLKAISPNIRQRPQVLVRARII